MVGLLAVRCGRNDNPRREAATTLHPGTLLRRRLFTGMRTPPRLPLGASTAAPGACRPWAASAGSADNARLGPLSSMLDRVPVAFRGRRPDYRDLLVIVGA